MELTESKNEETLFIGDTIYDMQCAQRAGVQFGLAVWGCRHTGNLRADYYFNAPADILYPLDIERNRPAQAPWLKWAVELQFIAQAGLTYSKDPFDIERFARIREISAEVMSLKTGQSLDFVRNVFCNETGFQTPKLDTRAAIFENGKILLVKENNGKWSLPGGWVDVNESIKTNTAKEVREEAGLNVIPVKLIAVQDRNLHNPPVYAYGVAKAFVLCEIIDGQFTPNIETLESRYFSLDEIPPLSEEKNTLPQIKLCFDACATENWQTVFD